MKRMFRKNSQAKQVDSESVQTNKERIRDAYQATLERLTTLATLAKTLSKRTRALGFLTLLAALWLWFFLFRGAIMDWNWLAYLSLPVLILFVAPSFFVFQLHSIFKQTVELPESFKTMQEEVMSSSSEALGLFAKGDTAGLSRASLKAFNLVRQLRGLVKSVPELFGSYRGFLKLSNPLYALLLALSFLACFVVNGLGLVTFLVWLGRQIV